MTFDSSMPGPTSLDSRFHAGAEQETIELRPLDQEEGRLALFLEMHGADRSDKCRRVSAIERRLWELGYRSIIHVETQTRITPQNAETAAPGHLYAPRAG